MSDCVTVGNGVYVARGPSRLALYYSGGNKRKLAVAIATIGGPR
jgi:ABC-type multidrug transport system ATPase subunit